MSTQYPNYLPSQQFHFHHGQAAIFTNPLISLHMQTVQDLLDNQDANPPRNRFINVITPEEDERLPPVQAAREQIPVYTPGRNHQYPANSYIINSIDWTLLADEHPLHDGRPERRHDADEREHIRRYAAARGTILHTAIERHHTDDYADLDGEIADVLDDIDTAESDTHNEAYEAVSKWNGSTKTDTVRTPSDAGDALREAARMEADTMETRWLEWRRQHDVDIISREHVYAHSPDEFRRDRGHGGQADILINVSRESDLPATPGIYAGDIKTSPVLNNAHRMQAEAHRHALSEKMNCVVGGMLLRVSPTGVDVETHHEDSWPSDELWQTFREKLRYLYDETLLEVVLTIGDR